MKLLCVGDIGFGASDPFQLRSPLPDVISSDKDFRTLFNWELPLGTSVNPISRVSGPRLIGDPSQIQNVTKWAPGFAALSNNHIMDAGEQGLSDTLTSLNRLGFATIGAGANQNDIQEPIIWQGSEGRLGIINWVFPETHPDWKAIPGPNCWPGFKESYQVITALKKQVDWVMVYTHWSDELFQYPRIEDRLIAYKLAAMGADMIIGNHPHVVRGMEVIGSCPVFYSIGNFHFSDIRNPQGGWLVQLSPRNKEGLGILLDFQRKQTPTIQLLSFRQLGDHTIKDKNGYAEARLRHSSKPLSQINLSDYRRWYQKKREAFDAYWCRWHFGFRRVGFRGLFPYFLRIIYNRR